MLKKIIVGSTIAAVSWAAYYNARRWWATWGIDAADSARALPGDGLVPAPGAIDTRSITIDAPPEAVWPWLVQMGFGRGGWYSWDQMDMKGRSADAILPEFQSLSVGDTVPTHSAGGFVVREIVPDRALVLYLDTAIVEGWKATAGAPISATETPGLAMSGGFLEAASPPKFAASWAFVLEPLGDGRTRLVERLRAWFGPATPGSRVFQPLMGFGVFVMVQKQMVGLRERVERAELQRLADAGATGSPPPVKATQVAPPIRATSPKLPNGPATTEPGTLPA